MANNNSNHSGCKSIVVGILLLLAILVCATVGISITLWRGMQNYTSLGENSKVAEVCFSQPQPFEWSGNIGFFDKYGNLSHPQKFSVTGEHIQLHGDFVILSSFLNMFGIRSGYRLIRADGAYTASKSKNTSPHAPYTQTSYNFNSEDWFFTSASNFPILSWFVKPVPDSSQVPFNSPGIMKTTLYIIYATDQGLVLKAVSQKLTNCDTLPA